MSHDTAVDINKIGYIDI